MRIGLVIYGSLDTLSGGYLYDRTLVEYLRAQGDTVEIISLPWRNYASHLTDNVTFRMPEGLDLLIQDELNHPSLIAANRGRHPYPAISIVHHLRCSEQRPAWQNRFYRLVEKAYLQRVDGFIFNSKTTQNVVSGLIGEGKPHVVAYPPTDKFGDPMSEREIIDRAETNELRILFIGNIIRRKGLHTLLKAVKGLRRRPDGTSFAHGVEGSKVRVDVVGRRQVEPEYAYEMERYTLIHELSSTIISHGALDNRPLMELYRQAHILVVPSSYEGYGIVYLEGMGFGLPAIGTTAGAAGEIITHGQDGYLIEPGDAEALAGHINELAASRKLLLNLSLNARKRYLAQPQWVDTAGRIRGFLQKQIREFSV